jgi:hypothetical protein
MARLEQILRIARPQGFEVMPQFWGGSRQIGAGDVVQPNNVVEHSLFLWFFSPTKQIAGEGCICITITVNPQVGSGDGPVYRDAQGRSVYREPPRDTPIPLATQVYNHLTPNTRSWGGVLLTSGNELPWKPVTREDYYNAVIFDFEGKDGAKLAPAVAAMSKSPYEEWMAGAAQRKTDREGMLTMMATTQTPAEVAKFRKTLEDTERDVTASLKASEAADRQTSANELGAVRSIGDRVRAELGPMTPAQRRMPALVDMTTNNGATGGVVVERDAPPSVRRILTPNYEFWRARSSPVEAHSISIGFSASGTGEVPAVQNALWQAFKKLDYAALKRLLDAPR